MPQPDLLASEFWVEALGYWAKHSESLYRFALIVAGFIGIPLLYVRTVAAHRQARTAEQGHITDRFTAAIEQLGSDKMAVRLGAIYALERISKDSRRDHWTIVETLTAFVRAHAPWRQALGNPFVQLQVGSGGENTSEESKEEAELPAIPIRPATDIQAVLTVLGRRDEIARKQDKAAGRRLDLAGTDLRGINLRSTHLGLVRPTSGVLSLAAHLERADFTGAHLEGADLHGAYLERADFTGARLQGADLSHAHLERADFTGAHLKGADLHGAYLERADLRAAYLKGVNLREAHLKGGFTLLSGAELECANLQYADLKSARLVGARFKKASLVGAHLEGADLQVAHLEGASLREAHLLGADFSGAHLEGADLREAVGLTREQLARADGDAKTIVADELRPAHWPTALR